MEKRWTDRNAQLMVFEAKIDTLTDKVSEVSAKMDRNDARATQRADKIMEFIAEKVR